MTTQPLTTEEYQALKSLNSKQVYAFLNPLLPIPMYSARAFAATERISIRHTPVIHFLSVAHFMADEDVSSLKAKGYLYHPDKVSTALYLSPEAQRIVYGQTIVECVIAALQREMDDCLTHNNTPEMIESAIYFGECIERLTLNPLRYISQ